MNDLVMSEAVIATGGGEVARAQSVRRSEPGLNLPLAGALFLHLSALFLLISGGGGTRELPPQVVPIHLYSAAEMAVVVAPAESRSLVAMVERRVVAAPVVAAPSSAMSAAEAVAVVRRVDPPIPGQVVAPAAVEAVAAQAVSVPTAVEASAAHEPSPRLSTSGGGAAVASGSAPGRRAEAIPRSGGTPSVASGVTVASAVAPGASPLVLAQPLYRENPAPEYPPLARRRGLEGTVVLAVQVDVTGRAAEVLVNHSSGQPLLDEAALKAVKSWRFEPGRRGIEPVAMQVLVPVRFGLR